MRRGESNMVAKAAAARRAAADPSAAPPRGVDARSLPVRVQLVRLQADVVAADACCVTLALHGQAISHNLECVLSTVDPEGPHQLRIALRRTRVALRVFEPVMRRKVNARLVETARMLGRIVGELRDADVMIDEMIAPAAQSETALMAALTTWRQEVRGRVRAKLSAIDASAIAADFTSSAASASWLKKAVTHVSFTSLLESAHKMFTDKAAPLAARLPCVSSLELHQLRKAVKALRYCAELGASVGHSNDAGPRLKRIQDALGYVNDTVALQTFDPPVCGETQALRWVRERIVAQRLPVAAEAISTASREWARLLDETGGSGA